MSVTGDDGVTETWVTSYGITCINPSFDGLDILFFAGSPDNTAVVLITLTATSIGVSERAGSGENYTDREFAGHGVTAFDPSRGATFDSDVTIVPSTSNPGTLGTITHVRGSVDCGGQTPGSSTVVLSGSTADGAVNGPFELFRVTCYHSAAYGDSVSTTAIVTAGTSATLLIIHLPANDEATIFSLVKDVGTNRTYAIDPAGSQSISLTGAQVDADFTEVVAAGATPHVIHLAGELTCGTTIAT